MRLVHHGTRVYEGREVRDGGRMLDDFANMDCPRRGQCNDETVLQSADVAILLTSESDVCGIAYLNSVWHPYAMATHSCARYNIRYNNGNRLIAEYINFAGDITRFYMSWATYLAPTTIWTRT